MKKNKKIVLKVIGSLILLLVILFCISLFINTNKKIPGDISNVKINIGTSENYSETDLLNAVEAIKEYFKEEFNGCTLEELTYVGDIESKIYQEWGQRKNKNEVIVFTSSFKIGTKGYDDSFKPNSEETNWRWIFARNEGEQWIHIDHGLG